MIQYSNLAVPSFLAAIRLTLPKRVRTWSSQSVYLQDQYSSNGIAETIGIEDMLNVFRHSKV